MITNAKLAGLFMSLCVSMTWAQTAWDVNIDNLSTSECGIVNAVSAETGLPIQLVILTETAELMIVSRTDTILSFTQVDLANQVFDDGVPRGFVEFADDGDGFRTVWWVSLDGSVVLVDPFTAEIFAGTDFPEDFINVPCDACEFVDLPPAGECFTDPPIDPIPIIVNVCGSMGGLAMVLCMGGFAGLSVIRRRW